MNPLASTKVNRLEAAVRKEIDKLRELLAEASSYSVDTVNPRENSFRFSDAVYSYFCPHLSAILSTCS